MLTFTSEPLLEQTKEQAPTVVTEHPRRSVGVDSENVRADDFIVLLFGMRCRGGKALIRHTGDFQRPGHMLREGRTEAATAASLNTRYNTAGKGMEFNFPLLHRVVVPFRHISSRTAIPYTTTTGFTEWGADNIIVYCYALYQGK